MRQIDQVAAYLKEAAKFKSEPVPKNAKAQFLGDVVRYEAVFVTGDFDGNGDYGNGILGVGIYLAYDAGAYKYDGLISIINTDDGVWQAQAIGGVRIDGDMAKKLVELFDSYQGRLPSEEILNQDLAAFGLWGQYTG